jgi:hypothetical protein
VDLQAVLREWDHTDKADWLDARLATLSEPASTPNSRDVAIEELHQVVLGMGGLMDLTPPSTANYIEESERLHRLADRLYLLTET